MNDFIEGWIDWTMFLPMTLFQECKFRSLRLLGVLLIIPWIPFFVVFGMIYVILLLVSTCMEIYEQ
jgi:hypothetical protein